MEPADEVTAVISQHTMTVSRRTTANDQNTLTSQRLQNFTKTQMICDVEIVFQRQLQHCKYKLLLGKEISTFVHSTRVAEMPL